MVADRIPARLPEDLPNEASAGTDANRGEYIQYVKMDNYVDIMKLIRDYPDYPCIVRAKDLDHYSHQLVDGVREEMEKQMAKIMAEKREEYIIPDEVESTYHISRTTLYRLAKAGILVPVWVGGQRRFRRSELEAYINQ